MGKKYKRKMYINKEKPAYQSLYDLFPEEGMSYPIEEVYEIIGLRNHRSVAVYLSEFKRLPEDQRINVVVKNGILTRKPF